MSFSLETVRADFPALQQEIDGKPLVYLDSAATALKPQAVIDAVVGIYSRDCANVHRGVHRLAQRATDAYEGSRETVRRFLGAADVREIVFVRGATEAINLVAQSFARPRLQPGDEVLVTAIEHHANLVPWQMVCEQTGARLVVVPMNAATEVELDAFAAKLSSRTRMIACAHVSNAFGSILPVQEMVRIAHAHDVPILIDGAQAAPHLPIDVQRLGCDFYVFSGHKVYGPSGIGVLYGRSDRLSSMPPYQGGGDMIDTVHFAASTYQEPPYRFEAGTPHIAGAVGLGAALDYLEGLGWPELIAHEAAVRAYAEAQLTSLPGLRIIGRAKQKIGVVSLHIEGVHPHDLATLLDLEGVAVRVGFHCAQPAIESLGLSGTLRASLGLYTTSHDIDRFVAALSKAQEMLT